jgi:hypothetical protein
VAGSDYAQAASFRLWSPIDVVEKGDVDSTRRGRIEGIASSEAIDADKEVVVQKGLDWGWFMTKGFVSLEHPLGVHNIVGEPIEVSPVTLTDGVEATKITCDLLLDDPAAKSIYDKARTLKKADSKRKLGFSIEGRVIERDGNTINKAEVVSVAISAVPKNPLTWFEPIMASQFWRSLVGYPQQGMPFSGEFAPLAVQSMQGVPSVASYGVKDLEHNLSKQELLTAHLLRKLPQMSWSQGLAAIQEILSNKENG